MLVLATLPASRTNIDQYTHADRYADQHTDHHADAEHHQHADHHAHANHHARRRASRRRLTLVPTPTPTPTPTQIVLIVSTPVGGPTTVPLQANGCYPPLSLTVGGQVLLRGGVNVRSQPTCPGRWSIIIPARCFCG